MRVRELRFLTAVTIIAASGLAVLRGVDFVSFSIARAGAARSEDATSSLERWRRAQGVAAEAMQALLASPYDPSNREAVRNRATLLVDYLSAKPSSSINWLSLAALRVVSREPAEKVFGALLLSYVTGPNEGVVMAQRGVFAVSQWEIMPADFRNRAINDLAASLMTAADSSDDLREKLRSILAAKAPEVRQEIGATLRQMTGVSPQRLAASGL